MATNVNLNQWYNVNGSDNVSTNSARIRYRVTRTPSQEAALKSQIEIYPQIWKTTGTGAYVESNRTLQVSVGSQNKSAVFQYNLNSYGSSGTYYNLDDNFPFKSSVTPPMTFIVKHNIDGTLKDLNLYAYFPMLNSGSGKNHEVDININLPAISVHAKISAYDAYFYLGNEYGFLALNSNNYSLHTIIKNEDDIIFVQRNTGATDTILIEFEPEEIDAIYQYIGAFDTSTNLILRLESYSGSTFKGYDEKNITAYIQNSNPIFTDFEYADTNAITLALTGDNQKLIKGYSELEITIPVEDAAAAQHYAEMVQYKTHGASADWNNTEPVILEVSHLYVTANIAVEAMDTRQLSTTVTKTVPFVEYANLKITQVQLKRDNTIDAPTQIKINGTITNVDFGAVNNAFKTDGECKYRYKSTAAGEAWSSYITLPSLPTISGNEFELDFIYINGNLGSNGFTTNKSFLIEVTLSDKLSTSTFTVTLNTGIPLLTYIKNYDEYGEFIGYVIYANGNEPISTLKIGTIYHTADAAFDPNTVWGGTWELIDKHKEDIVILGSTNNTYFTPSSNISGHNFNCKIRNDVMWLRVNFTTAVDLNDNSIEIGTIRLDVLGLNTLQFAQYPHGYTDAGNGILTVSIAYTTGVISNVDIVSKTGGSVIASGSGCNISFVALISPEMITSGIKEYVWERIS